MNARIKLTLAALALSSFALGGCVRSAGSAPNSATSSDGGAVVSTPIHFPEPSALNMPAPPAPAVIDSIPAGGSSYGGFDGSSTTAAEQSSRLQSIMDCWACQ